jgi:excisionase family DNA binding protein
MVLRYQFGQMTMTLPDRVRAMPGALTVRELADLVHVSERLIYRMAAEGTIPSLRICGAVRFDPTVTAAWLRRSMICSAVSPSTQTNSKILRRA